MGVPEGRHNVAHRARPERSEGEAVGNCDEDDQKTPTGVTHGCGLYRVSISDALRIYLHEASSNELVHRALQVECLSASWRENFAQEI
jgi:hypothetical protein